MQIEYSSRFKQSFHEIMECGGKYYSKTTLKAFFINLTSIKKMILSNPFMGSQERLFEGTEWREYRSIVVYKYLRLIYLVYEDKIYFADIWDTRQSPTKLKERFEK